MWELGEKSWAKLMEKWKLKKYARIYVKDSRNWRETCLSRWWWQYLGVHFWRSPQFEVSVRLRLIKRIFSRNETLALHQAIKEMQFRSVLMMFIQLCSGLKLNLSWHSQSRGWIRCLWGELPCHPIFNRQLLYHIVVKLVFLTITFLWVFIFYGDGWGGHCILSCLSLYTQCLPKTCLSV